MNDIALLNTPNGKAPTGKTLIPGSLPLYHCNCPEGFSGKNYEGIQIFTLAGFDKSGPVHGFFFTFIFSTWKVKEKRKINKKKKKKEFFW